MSDATPGSVVSAKSMASSLESSDCRTMPLTALRRIREIETLIECVASSWHSSETVLDSRRWHRLRCEKPLIVTPLDDETEIPSGEPFVVVGRDVSRAGVSFAHKQPLASRKVSVSFPIGNGSSESIITLLKWCRFTRDGVYHSGGRFLRSSPPV